MNILFVMPAVPKKVGGKATNDLNHKAFPIGLLKLATWQKAQGNQVQLVVGKTVPDIDPDEIWITTIFTYWETYYRETIRYYSFLYPRATIRIGGIYATLHPDRALQIGADAVHRGIVPEVEGIIPDYSLLPEPVKFAVVHSQRGCVSRCKYCMTYLIEPDFTVKTADQVIKEIQAVGEQTGIKEFAFYDNNPLANPHIKVILQKLSEQNIRRVEFKSGFDTRYLTRELAKLLKNARVIKPRIAWDDPGKSKIRKVEESISLLVDAGFREKEIEVFMIYNHDQDFATLEQKRKQCQEWGVQISDCRYVPRDLFQDGYKPREQTNDRYYIHPGWTNQKIRAYRRNCRGQNILVRMLNGKKLDEYQPSWEKHSIPKTIIQEFTA